MAGAIRTLLTVDGMILIGVGIPAGQYLSDGEMAGIMVGTTGETHIAMTHIGAGTLGVEAMVGMLAGAGITAGEIDGEVLITAMAGIDITTPTIMAFIMDSIIVATILEIIMKTIPIEERLCVAIETPVEVV